MISGVFKVAVLSGTITSSPVLSMKDFFGKAAISQDPKEHINPFTESEVDIFLDKTHKLYPELFAFYATALGSGLRLGELLALGPEHVDLKNGVIKVARAVKHGTANTLGPPKSKASYRDVEIGTELVATLSGSPSGHKKTSPQERQT